MLPATSPVPRHEWETAQVLFPALTLATLQAASPHDELRSAPFRLNGTAWCLVIRPRTSASSSGAKPFVSLYLKLSGAAVVAPTAIAAPHPQQIAVDFSVQLVHKPPTGERVCSATHRFRHPEDLFGWAQYMEHEQLAHCFDDDGLSFQVWIRTVSPVIELMVTCESDWAGRDTADFCTQLPWHRIVVHRNSTLRDLFPLLHKGGILPVSSSSCAEEQKYWQFWQLNATRGSASCTVALATGALLPWEEPLDKTCTPPPMSAHHVHVPNQLMVLVRDLRRYENLRAVRELAPGTPSSAIHIAECSCVAHRKEALERPILLSMLDWDEANSRWTYTGSVSCHPNVVSGQLLPRLWEDLRTNPSMPIPEQAAELAPPAMFATLSATGTWQPIDLAATLTVAGLSSGSYICCWLTRPGAQPPQINSATISARQTPITCKDWSLCGSLLCDLAHHARSESLICDLADVDFDHSEQLDKDFLTGGTQQRVQQARMRGIRQRLLQKRVEMIEASIQEHADSTGVLIYQPCRASKRKRSKGSKGSKHTSKVQSSTTTGAQKSAKETPPATASEMSKSDQAPEPVKVGEDEEPAAATNREMSTPDNSREPVKAGVCEEVAATTSEDACDLVQVKADKETVATVNEGMLTLTPVDVICPVDERFDDTATSEKIATPNAEVVGEPRVDSPAHSSDKHDVIDDDDRSFQVVVSRRSVRSLCPPRSRSRRQANKTGSVATVTDSPSIDWEFKRALAGCPSERCGEIARLLRDAGVHTLNALRALDVAELLSLGLPVWDAFRVWQTLIPPAQHRELSLFAHF